MSPFPSSPPQTSVTTLDEPHTRSVKSPIHICPIDSPKHATRPQPDSPSSSSQPPAPPTPSTSSPPHSTVSTNISMSAIQSDVQHNSPSKNLSETSIPVNSSPSCLILPEPTPSLRRDQPLKVSSQPFSSGIGIADQVSFPTTSRHSITPSFSFPGASSPATAYNSVLPDSVDSHLTLTTVSSTDSISTTSQRTPNVYINGLPPHFSEQDLFALARPFGDIKSVRTFTRHVSEKPTGYGFVLFNDIDSAQRCIEGLRKYRNFHPSFSKVHRIPGTEYAQQSATHSTDQDEHTFKSRMEKLKDITSTNLYIEGLPLSIDEKSLAALMVPHKIKSSRFFETKLSNPPRIIAFVRLETRVVAEEVIERLHGRMVRGWNDPGCRISVRFADSAEQRELRRAERTLKNGEQSPSRLTIAQAALLNLRGQDFQTNVRDVKGVKNHRLTDPRLDNRATLTPSSDSRMLPTSRSLPSKLRYTYRESPLPPTSDLPITSEMDSLLQSIQNMGYDDGSLDSTMRSLAIDNEYLMTQQAQLRALTSAALLSPDPLPITLPRGHTQARNGFTPAEDLILEAHAQRLQLQAQLAQSSSIFEPISSFRKLNANIQSLDPVFHEPLQAPGLVAKPMFSQDTLPSISEDDFHAMGHPPRSFAPTFHELQGLADGCPSNAPSPTSAIFVRPPSRAVSIVPPPPDYEEPGRRSKGILRRTSVVSKQISCPSSTSNNYQFIPSVDRKLHPSSLQASNSPNSISSSSSNDNDSNTSTIPCEKIELQHAYMYSHGDTRSNSEEDKAPRFRPSHTSQIYMKKSPQLGEQHSMTKEAPKSPAVVSPALTYSSRTPSTLSPATPFFGSFAGSQDAFEVMMVENEDVAERRVKGRMTSK